MSSEYEWGEYEVYEMLDGEKHRLALCHEYKVADLITRLFASKDPNGGWYFYTAVPGPTDFAPGGGWYEGYRMKDGRLETRSLA